MRFALLLLAFMALSALAQNADPVTSRTYQLAGPAPSKGQYLAELATVVRTVADARDLSIDAEARQFSFGGRGEAPEMSEWLLKQLDRAPDAKPSETPEWHSAKKDDNAAVFFPAHVSGPRELSQVVTILRVVGDVQKVFSYSPLNALAVRGSAAEIAMVKWLVESVDRSAGAVSTKIPEFRIEGVVDPVVRVYYLANAKGEDLNRIITAVRVSGGIQKTFVDSEKSTLLMRGRPEDMAKAESILLTMDQQLAR